MEAYFESIAGSRATGWGPEVQAPAIARNAVLSGVEVFVDLADLIDVSAEIDRKTKELDKLKSLIVAQEKKLSNENFVSRAPEAVVQKERERLQELHDQLAATAAVLERLTASS